MKKIFKKSNFYIIGALFIYILFLYITKMTPLAGDDWGYALNGMKGNPISTAVSFYYSWSGRFFSELWGFVITPRKYLWNILNPLFFTLIFVFVYKLGTSRRNPILSVLLITSIMLSVDDNLRMETYSWIMGTTYVIPLMFSLLYFYFAIKLITEGVTKKTLICNYLTNISLFVGGMMMENISACMVGGIVILILYCYFTGRKELIKYLVINLVFAGLAFVLMRMSPGSAYRLTHDNAKWLAKPLLERLISAYPNFLEMTFIFNNYMILFFSLVQILLATRKINIKNIVSILINVLAVFAVFSFVIFKGDNIFTSGNSIFSMVFWPIYVINSFVVILNNIENRLIRDKATFILVIAGANALAMLFSPIYGSRSAIYTVYYIIVLSVILLNELNFKKYETCLLMLVFMFVICDRTVEYVSKYASVNKTFSERLEILEYYRRHPEDEDVWIPRFGIFTVHGGDIEPDDSYHFETFKEYFELPQSADNIHFYFKED